MRLILLIFAFLAATAYAIPMDNAVAKLTERACPAHCAEFCPDCCKNYKCADVSRRGRFFLCLICVRRSKDEKVLT
jgi:hypothetical protein